MTRFIFMSSRLRSKQAANKAKNIARKMRGLDPATLGPCWRRYDFSR